MRAIVYAMPGGAVGSAFKRYWEAVDSRQLATSAQQYPPHCSLTGFATIPIALLDEVDETLRVCVASTIGQGPVTHPLLERRRQEGWLGLYVSCPGWAVLAQAFADSCESLDFEAVRLKSEHHLSLAYGLAFAAEEHLAIAREVFDGVDLTDATWQIGFWTVEGGRWHLRRAVDWC